MGEREKTREWAGGEGDREQEGEREKCVCERDRDKVRGREIEVRNLSLVINPSTRELGREWGLRAVIEACYFCETRGNEYTCVRITMTQLSYHSRR